MGYRVWRETIPQTRTRQSRLRRRDKAFCKWRACRLHGSAAGGTARTAACAIPSPRLWPLSLLSTLFIIFPPGKLLHMANCSRYLLSIALIMSGICTKAQPFPDLQFNHITTTNGLSSNTATAVTEDKAGFIWIGTDNGLNRWDGYRFKQYFHNDQDSNSLILNGVQNLHCDRKGRIWIITGGGISCFLPDRNIFLNYAPHLLPPRRIKSNNSILLTEEKDGTIWITHQQNVIYRVKDDMSLQEIQINVASFPFENIQKEGYDGIMEDRRGNEWAFCANRIYLLDRQTKQPRQTFDFSRELEHASISRMIVDKDGHYWVCTWGKLMWLFDPGSHQLRQAGKVPCSNIMEWRFNDHDWLVGSDIYGGVYLFDHKGDSLKKLEWNPSDPYSLSGTTFNALFADRYQNLWISTNRGVNYVAAAGKIFDTYPITNPGKSNYDRATTEIPFSYFEDGSDTWLSKRYKSTFLYDRDMKIKKCYTSLYPLSATIERWRQNAYYFFKRGADLYISTDSGMVIYDLLHATTKLYFPPTVKEGPFRTIVALDSSRILIRTVTEGLFVFNTVTKTFVRHLSPHDSLLGPLPQILNYLLKTSQGRIFLSGDAGHSLTEYLPEKERFVRVQPRNEDRYHLLSCRVFGMEEDKQGRLWLASSNGVFIYNIATNTIDAHFNNDGKMGLLFRICFDNYQNAWVNGNSGIWCYLTSKNKWINFNGQDGLSGSDFEGIIARRSNGDIIAGLEGAIAIFHPNKLSTSCNEAPAIITEAGAGDRPQLFSLVKDGTKELALAAGEHSFSVDFAVLNYFDAASVQYLYKLDPLMSDFRINNNGHINFNGLMPGHYTLHVRGQNKTGGVYTKEDAMEIDIAPYWYQSWWFRWPALLLLAALAIYLVKRRIASIRNESALREKIVETEMQALRAQMDPHFIFNSLSSIENFIMQNEKRLASDYLNKFARLIRMILDSSRNELVPLAKDMEALQLYIDLEQISCNNKFTYETLIDPVLLNEDYHVPPLLIQPYVENAIVHGLMPSRGEDLILTVIARLESDRIRYIVEDNGVGRQQAREYSRRNKPYHKSVGLKITEERINIFNRQTRSNGSVVITDLYDESDKARGTRVDITIKAM
jgi:ligand-binding sensor domain-containing protein